MVLQLKFDIGRLVLVVIASLGLMHALPVSAQTQNETASVAVLPKAQLSIFSTSSRQKKRADFIVELARTPEHQRQGLMFRPQAENRHRLPTLFSGEGVEQDRLR